MIDLYIFRIPDSWVLESEAPSLSTCVIPLSKLPRDTVTALHPSLYNQVFKIPLNLREYDDH